MIPAHPSRKVLFLCTGNAVRSILGEYLLRAKGRGRFETFSAGSHPAGGINPLARRILRERFGLPTDDARSKSWDEFAGVEFDFVFTLSERARELCPGWPGRPVIAHWGSPDPAEVEGAERIRYRAFAEVATQIVRRIDAFCTLPEPSLRDAAAVRAVGGRFPLESAALPVP